MGFQDHSTVPECETLFREGTVLAINTIPRTMDIEIDGVTFEDVAVHYHCLDDWKNHSHPHTNDERDQMLSAFAVGDTINVMCNDQGTPLAVDGFLENSKSCGTLIVLKDDDDWWFWSVLADEGYHKDPGVSIPSAPNAIKKYWTCEGDPTDPPTLKYSIMSPFQVISSGGACGEDCGLAEFDKGTCCAAGGSVNESDWDGHVLCIDYDSGPHASHDICSVCGCPCPGGGCTSSCTTQSNLISYGYDWTDKVPNTCDGYSWDVDLILSLGIWEVDNVEREIDDIDTIYEVTIEDIQCGWVMTESWNGSGWDCYNPCLSSQPIPRHESACFNADVKAETGTGTNETHTWTYSFDLNGLSTEFVGSWVGQYRTGTYEIIYCDAEDQCGDGNPCPYSIRSNPPSGDFSSFEWTETSWGIDGSWSTYLDGKFAVLIPKLVLSINSAYETDNGTTENSYLVSAVTSIILRIVDADGEEDFTLATSNYSDSGVGFINDRADLNIKPVCYNANEHLPERATLRAFHWCGDELLVLFEFASDYHGFLFEKSEGAWQSINIDSFIDWIEVNSLEGYNGFLKGEC